jgi:hypothetical protein
MRLRTSRERQRAFGHGASVATADVEKTRQSVERSQTDWSAVLQSSGRIEGDILRPSNRNVPFRAGCIRPDRPGPPARADGIDPSGRRTLRLRGGRERDGSAGPEGDVPSARGEAPGTGAALNTDPDGGVPAEYHSRPVCQGEPDILRTIDYYERHRPEERTPLGPRAGMPVPRKRSVPQGRGTDAGVTDPPSPSRGPRPWRSTAPGRP